MILMQNIRLKCAHCGGPKFVGEEYYSNGSMYVDITCVKCSDSKDIKVEDFKKFLNKLSKQRKINGKE